MSSTDFKCLAARALLIAVLPIGHRALAQTTTIQGSIVGNITDLTGAVIAGAQVVATNVATNIEVKASSNEAGFYRVERLLPGPYRLTVEHPGFKSLVREGLNLSADQSLRVDVRLEVGVVTEKVQVVGESPMIETESAQISSVRGWEQRVFLPTSYPSFFSTTALEPGATTGDPSFEVSFAGSRATQYTYSVNGATFRARPSADGTLTALFIEWQQEIKSSYVNNSAEYPVLANVNVTSKSGANEFHGSGVWYYLSGGLQGRDPFSPRRPSGVNHLYASSLGGPVVRNRAFFYGAISGERDSSAATRNNTVPTARMRQGDFGEIATSILDPSTGAPFPLNRIPESRIFAGSRAYLNRFVALPNFGSGFQTQNYRQIFPQRINSDNLFTRIDWRLSDRHSMFGSYNFTWGNRGRWYSGTITFPEQIGPRLGYRRPQAAVVSDTFVMRPNLFNELNLSWTREHNNIKGSMSAEEALSTLGVQGVRPVGIPGMPVLSIAGFTAPAQQSWQDIAEASYTIRDNVSWIVGPHRLKTGVVVGQSRLSQVPFNVDLFLGSYSFTNNFATGYAMADFLLGYPQSVSRQNADFFDTVYRRGNMAQVFFQDDIQVTQRLSVNLGLRYQYHQPFLDKNGRAYAFDLATTSIVIPSESSRRLLNPLLVNAFPIVTAGQAGFPARLVNADRNNFAPRLGFAYRLTGNTVVRAGYGVFFDFNLPVQGNLAPFIPSESFPPNRIASGLPEYRFPNPFPPTPNAVGTLSLAVANPGGVLPYTQQWSLTVEQQVMQTTAVRLSYTGTRTIKSFYGRQINVPLPSTTPFSQARRPLPQFGGISIDTNGQGHFYQGVQAQVEHRRRGGLFFRSHYTLAKDLGETGNDNPFDRRADIGETAYIRRHQWISEYNWDLPFGRGRKFGSNLPLALDRMLGGWVTTGILQAASGRYLTPTYSGYDSSGTGILGGRPDRLRDGNLPSSERSASRWFDAGAFAIPGAASDAPLTPPRSPIGRFGNSGVGIIEGPGRWQFDVGLVKYITLFRERSRLNLFVLATNVFNHPNLGDPSLTITAPNVVGQISGIHSDGNTSGVGMRQLRLGIRIDF